jgi:Fe-S-cluster containining protein
MIKKFKRVLESLFPVQMGRIGRCKMCGACCRLPFKCLFLSKGGICRIYAIRPPQCRKFPRTKADRKEVKDCGFHWD